MQKQLSIDVFSEKEIEDIAYECAVLLQNGWRRIKVDRYNDDFIRNLNYHYDVAPLEGDKWVKQGASHSVWLDKKYSIDPVKIEINLFSRSEAINFEGL